MALRLLLHSACHVLGHPYGEQDHGEVNKKSLKGFISSGNSTEEKGEEGPSSEFQMPLHYPRYTKGDYEKMEEWKVDLLLKQYGLSFKGTLDEKMAYAMGAFLWPADQY